MLVMPISPINERVRKFLILLVPFNGRQKKSYFFQNISNLLTNKSYLGVKKVIWFDKSCVVYYYPKFQWMKYSRDNCKLMHWLLFFSKMYLRKRKKVSLKITLLMLFWSFVTYFISSGVCVYILNLIY